MNLTLSQRLSLAFSILLLACCGASAWLQIRANDLHEKEVIQSLSRGLAKSIAVDTQIMGSDGLLPDAVRRLFSQLMMVNPSIEVYLLDPTGRIIGHDAPTGHLKRNRIRLDPVLRFLEGQALPILGDDPRSPGDEKVFSAAALHIDGRDIGYIYVILMGEEHDQLAAHIAASTVLRTTLWSMALVALLGLAAGLIAFGLITRPLRHLTETMRRFDTQADPGASPPTPPEPPPSLSLTPMGGRNEIIVLEAAYHQMAARIGEQWHVLKQLDRDRREMVANISHDLRTPMASLHGYLETLSLKDATLTPVERQRYLAIALGQSRKVGQLAQALFELARLEHGLVEPLLEEFSLTDLIQDVFQKFELQAQTAQTRLTAVLPRPSSIVVADLGMIERVLTNLIDNALRHAPPGGVIDVALMHKPGAVLVTVSDTGPGIPVEQLDHLFKRPFRLEGERREGGLGLLIVHRILQLHNSDINLLRIPGKGATFCFELKTARD